MSAYICNPEHFGVLASYAVRNDCVVSPLRVTGVKDAEIRSAQSVAKLLARENIRSVAHRYPEGDLPGPCLSPADIEEAAAIYAAHFVVNPQRLRPIGVLKLCQGWDYQSSETDDWKDTLAWQQVDWIRGAAIRSLPGYDDADWSFDQQLPEIEALYQEV